MTQQSQALAVRPQQNAPLPAISRQELLSLVDTPEWRSDVGRAIVLANSGLVPDTMRGNPAAVLGAIWTCEALGVKPNPVTFAQIYSVHGKPGIMAQLMLGLAHAAGHESKWLEQSDVCCALKMDDQVFSFTIQQAKQAGLLKNETYAKFPMDMLGWKAATRAVRKVCPEVLLGLRAAAPQLLDEPVAESDDDLAAVEVHESRAVSETESRAVSETETRASAAAPVPDEQLVTPAGEHPDETAAAEGTPETVSIAEAKRELVSAALEAGLSELQARQLAKQIWASYQLPAGPVPQKTLNVLLAETRELASTQADQEAEQAETAVEEQEGLPF